MRRPLHDLTQPGWIALGAAVILFCVGLLCIYATEHDDPGPPAHTLRQLVYLGAALGAMLVVLRMGYQHIGRWAYPIYAVMLMALLPMLLARYVPLGEWVPQTRGSHRWIRLPGFQLQPSEFMKVGLILILAWYLRYRDNYRNVLGLLCPFVLTIVPTAMILLEPDLGTCLLMMPILFVMLFVAGARLKHLLMVLVLGAVCTPILWTQIRGYQRLRIVSVLLQSEPLREKIIAQPDDYKFLCSKRDAQEWSVASGMQLIRSKAALGSGGILGEGWGNGTYVRYDFLPDKHNDFIFSIIGQQWGLLGCLTVLACYFAIATAGLEIASVTADPFGRLIAIGVTALLTSQVLINVGMTIGLMPITGMTLPFVSFGGSSLLTNFIALALLISVSQNRPFLLAKKPFEFSE